jgi:hypothetical protein
MNQGFLAAPPPSRSLKEENVMTDENLPVVEPIKEPVPDADSFVELAAAFGAFFGMGNFNAASILNSLTAAQTHGSTGMVDRYLSSSFKDTDIGMDEVLRANLALGFQSQAGKKMVMDHVESMAALNGQHVDHARNSDDSFYSGLKKATSTASAGLLDAFGLETDNEVLSTAGLATVVKKLSDNQHAIAEDLAQFKAAILAGLNTANEKKAG